jgi:phosphoglycerol transferase MdoB-like AlkP superfamily enzyme
VALRLLLGTCVVLVGETIFRGSRDTASWAVSAGAALLASIVYVALCGCALELLCSMPTAFSLLAAVFWMYSFADGAKLAKLGIPATPSDLLLSQQYLEVSYMMWGPFAYVVAVVAACLLLTALVWAWKRTTGRHSARRWATIALRVMCLIFVVFVVAVPDYNVHGTRFRRSPIADRLDKWGIHNLNFDPAANTRANGQLLSFLMNARSATIHPPLGYGEAMIRAALTPGIDSTQETPSLGRDEAPDVVIIMSEAFWDPTRLPGLRFEDPLLAAADTTQRGTMFSPVFGGYTANTEFELLTRISNGTLPAGSIPYVQYVRRPMNSLAMDFRRAGYSTTALHPFDGNFWNRRNVYRNLGFQAFRDKDAFLHRDMTGPFINDHALAGEIDATLDSGTGPHFVFAVSLQGHAPYTGGMYRYASRVAVHDDTGHLSDDAIDQLSTYASGVRDAVQGFNEVVAHARRSRRKTMVVMFGDHLPSLGDHYMVYRQAGLLGSSNQSAWSDLDEEHMHSVPLLVWSNVGASMDLPTRPFSPIYLAGRIKREAGLPAGPLDIMLERMEHAYPVVSQAYSRDAAGRTVRGMPANVSLVNNYRAVCYDLLLGRGFTENILHPGKSDEDHANDLKRVSDALGPDVGPLFRHSP